MSSKKIPVALLGATGSVGQKFVELLADHPRFEIAELAASERSAGKPYAEAAEWNMASPLPDALAASSVKTCDPAAVESRLVFSALDSSVAEEIESAFRDAGRLVVTNARNHRMDADVPLVIPEVNPDHLAVVEQKLRAGAGAIVANPNCSTIGMTLALKPLHDAFGVERVDVVTMQALSGAGFPGHPAAALHDNVLPFIAGEEEKLEIEPRKILGDLADDSFRDADLTVSAACHRVPVFDGHLEAVSVTLGKPATEAAIIEAWRSFTSEPQRLGLPSAPVPPIVYFDDPRLPQPRLQRDLGGGMTVSVGRLRPSPFFDYKFVVLSHNTVRGAAGGTVLIAELLDAKGLL
ncbi:MAG: aspartate-semialdehyde dehydrogenase [Ignavibacteriales bacterium]|nr:aspartate-semialdehyde dehydrogenase [Ignavibacteriales bacterium]